MNWNNEQNNTLQTLNNLSVKWENQKIIEKRNYKRNQAKEKKTASSPVQDLHPDWDRIRGTMLYPLSCGELTIPGAQVLRLYVINGVCTARNWWKKVHWKSLLTLNWHYYTNLVVWFNIIQISNCVDNVLNFGV